MTACPSVGGGLEPRRKVRTTIKDVTATLLVGLDEGGDVDAPAGFGDCDAGSPAGSEGAPRKVDRGVAEIMRRYDGRPSTSVAARSSRW